MGLNLSRSPACTVCSPEPTSLAQELPEDLLLSIAGCLDSHIDRLSFGLVCRSWRSAIHKFRNPPLQSSTRFPWLVADWNEDTEATTFSISGDGIKKHYILPGPHASIAGSVAGWAILVFQDERIEIMNLLTRALIPLPSRTSLDLSDPYFCDSLKKIALSSSPQDSDCIAVAISSMMTQLFLARPRGAKWMPVDSPRDLRYWDLAFYEGKVWAVDGSGRVWVFDVKDPNPTARPASKLISGVRNPARYLVEIKGMLVQVVRRWTRDTSAWTIGFKVYMLEFGCWVRVDRLWGHNLFIGPNSSIIALEPTESSVERDCIFDLDYFYGNDPGVQKYCGVFNLAKGTIFKSPNLNPVLFPPFWITPHHSIVEE